MRDEGNRWVDPAPFEGARPQVPWWVWLPGWVKLVLAPFVLLWLTFRLAVKFVMLTVRYPIAVTTGLGGYVAYRQFGLSPLVLALLSVVCPDCLVRARPELVPAAWLVPSPD